MPEVPPEHLGDRDELDDQPLGTRVTITASFDDGSTRSEILTLPQPGLDLSDIIFVAVPGHPEDADTIDQIEPAVRMAVDRALGDADPGEGLDASIAAVGASLARRSTATAAQRAKFAKFESSPLRAHAIEALDTYLRALDGRCSPISRGRFWGVTVAVDKRTLLRVNVGLEVAMNVRPNGDVAVCVQGEQPTQLPDGAHAFSDGFATKKPNYSLVSQVDSFGRLMSDPRTVASARERVDVTWRPLMQNNYHNPLIDSLLL